MTQVQYVDVVRDMVRELRGQQAGAPNSTSQFSWFWRQRENHFSQFWRYLDVCSGDPPLSPAAAAARAATVKTTTAEGFWGVPKFDCAQAPSWTVAFSVPFFGCSSRRKLAFKYVERNFLYMDFMAAKLMNLSSSFPLHHTQNLLFARLLGFRDQLEGASLIYVFLTLHSLLRCIQRLKVCLDCTDFRHWFFVIVMRCLQKHATAMLEV